MIRQIIFFWEALLVFWFKFNNSGLALGMALKFYTNVAKELKLKIKKLWWLIPTFVEVTGEKLAVGVFLTPLPPTILKRVKIIDINLGNNDTKTSQRILEVGRSAKWFSFLFLWSAFWKEKIFFSVKKNQ